MTLWESQYNTSCLSHVTSKSFKRYKIHCNSHVAIDRARYSASEDDIDMVGYFFALHDISELPRKKTKPFMDLLGS